MNLVLLIRRVRARPDGQTTEALLGQCDAAALDAALVLRGNLPETHLTVIAAGPAAREDAVLRHALEQGADRALRLDEDDLLGDVDYYASARVLGAAIKRSPFDLVLVGDRSEDEGQGAVGPAVAEALGVPHVTGALDVATVAAGAAEVTRRDHGQVRTLRLALPALVTITSFSRRERTAPSAAPPSIEVVALDALGIRPPELKHRDRCLGRASPLRVARNATTLPSAEELVARLRDDHLLER